MPGEKLQARRRSGPRISGVHIAVTCAAPFFRVTLAWHMTLEQILRSVGGVARTRMLVQRGVTERTIRQSIGAVRRLRYGVLALPDAEQDLVCAVAAGARLTCVSAAAYYDLWRVRPASAVHVSRATGSTADCVNHRSRSVPPHHRLPVMGLVDVLVHVLQCRPVPIEGVGRVDFPVR